MTLSHLIESFSSDHRLQAGGIELFESFFPFIYIHIKHLLHLTNLQGIRTFRIERFHLEIFSDILF